MRHLHVLQIARAEAQAVLVRAHVQCSCVRTESFPPMSRVVFPIRKRPVGGALTLMHLSDDNLRLLFELIDIPLALKLTCRALRALAPEETETKVAHVVKGIGLIVWAHQCGLFEQVTPSQVCKHAAMTWPGGDEAIEYITSPDLYQHELESRASIADLCTAAARAGLIPMLEYLDYEEWFSKPYDKDHGPLCAAAEAGHLECVKWMFTRPNCTPIRPICTHEALDAAAATGQLEVVKWLVEQTTGYRGGTTCVAAAKGGHVAVLELLIGAGFPWNEDLYRRVMLYQRYAPPPLALIQYVVTKGLAWDREATWDEVVSHGETESVKWLVANDPDGVHFHGDSDEALVFAAGRGSTDILRLADEHGYALEPAMVDRAARWGHVKTVEWLHTKGVVGSEVALINAVERGHVDVLECLRAHGGYEFHPSLYEYAALNNQDEVLEWLESIGIDLPHNECERNRMLNHSLAHKNTRQAEWMLARGCGELSRLHLFAAADNYEIELFCWLVDKGCPYDLEALERICDNDDLGEHDPIGAIVAKLRASYGEPRPFATSDP